MVPTSVAIKSYRWGFFDLLIHNLRKTSAYCYFQLIFLFLFHLSVILVSPLCHSRPTSVIPVKTGIQSEWIPNPKRFAFG